jgi:hypothetical protein
VDYYAWGATRIKASDATALRGIELPVWAVLEVVTDKGMLDEDRTPAIKAWFERNIAGLPDVMLDDLRSWFDIMKDGCAVPPRRRPRAEGAVRLHLRWPLPTLYTWAGAGHVSLGEISGTAILDALRPSGNPRAEVGQGLKSMFRLLKGQ